MTQKFRHESVICLLRTDNKCIINFVREYRILFGQVYSKTSKILALTLLFPPVGSANILPHTKQVIFEDAFPNIICSFLHLGHLILTNLLVGSLILTIKHHHST